MRYEVCDCPVDSVHGIASRHEFPTPVQAWAALVTRVIDDYKDHCGEVYGFDDETGEPNTPVPAEQDFVEALFVANDALHDDLLPDVTYRGVRYWVEAHEFAREGGFREAHHG